MLTSPQELLSCLPHLSRNPVPMEDLVHISSTRYYSECNKLPSTLSNRPYHIHKRINVILKYHHLTLESLTFCLFQSISYSFTVIHFSSKIIFLQPQMNFHHQHFELFSFHCTIANFESAIAISKYNNQNYHLRSTTPKRSYYCSILTIFFLFLSSKFEGSSVLK